MEVADLLPLYAVMQAKVAEALANERIPLQVEIMLRCTMAEMCVKVGSQLSRQPLLEDAIQHLDYILRHIPQVSPDRPGFLNKLCEAEYELYCITGSQMALEESVSYGRQANDLSAASSFQEQNLDLRLEILTNLGHSLVQRFELKKNPPDLEDSIDCKREILRKAPRNSERYLTAVNNLASSLRLLYLCTEDDKYEKEASGLFRELLSSVAPGTQMHSIAIGQLGVTAAMKFRIKKTPEVLDDAIMNCNIGLKAYVPGYDGWTEMHRILVELCTEKFNDTGNLADMDTLVDNSYRLLESIPADHHHRGKFLLKHLQTLRECAFKTQSVDILESIGEKCHMALESMPVDYPTKTQSQLEYSHILGQKYFLSGSLQDLIFLVKYALTVSADFNAGGRASSRLSFSEVQTEWYHDLVSNLKMLDAASPDNSMRLSAEEELLEAFKSHYDFEAEKYAFMALDELYEFNTTRLRSFATATADDLALNCGKIEKTMASLSVEDDELLVQQNDRPETPILPFFGIPGQRLVNVDPQNGHMVFDIKDYVKTLIGQDDGPSSPSELVDSDERLEQKLMRRAREDGRPINPGLCYWCQWLCRLLKPTDMGLEFAAEDSRIPSSGDWKTILFRKSECAVCSLAASLITTAKGQLHTYFDKIEEGAKRIHFMLGRLPRGEGVLRVNVGLSYAGELRVLTPTNFRQALRQGWEIDSDALNPLETLLEDTDGPVHNKSRQQVNFKLIRRWLKDCDHNHGPACNHPRPGNRIKAEIDLVFIDVVKQCLVFGSSSEEYLVLSYTWGKVDMRMTLVENFEARQQPEALASVPFPKTIRDAMNLVRSLGERLLWIDAICIIQDDDSQKRRDIPNMDIVYGRAYATMVALHGEDANAGLPGVSPGTRACQQIETIDLAFGDQDAHEDPGEKTGQKCRFVRGPSPLPLVLQASTWSTRGWTLQERLLSRRCVYFSADAFYFECNRGTMAEGGLNEAYTSYSAGEVLDDQNVRQKPNQDNPISDLGYMHDLAVVPRLWKAWSVYQELVQMYTKRQFTFKPDVLDGFAGIFSVLDELHLQDTIESATMHGLPEGLFIHALLWTPAARIPRRGARLPPHGGAGHGQPDLRFPSWSWAGWDGPVDYRLFEGIKNDEDRPEPLVRKFRLGSLEIYPDKWETITHLVREIQEQDKGTPFEVQDDSLKETNNHKSDLGNLEAFIQCSTDNQDGLNRSNGSENKETVIQLQLEQNMIEEAGERAAVVDEVIEHHRGRKDKEKQRDLPAANTVLEMTAPTLPLASFSVSSNKEYLCLTDQVHTQGPQSVCRILDSDGEHCGLWWSQGGYEWAEDTLHPGNNKQLTLVGISAHGVCNRPLRGPGGTGGPIPLWDSEHFPSVGPQSGWVNVVVIDKDSGYRDGISSRCTVAIIHKMAWEKETPVQKIVRIA